MKYLIAIAIVVSVAGIDYGINDVKAEICKSNGGYWNKQTRKCEYP